LERALRVLAEALSPRLEAGGQALV
jgi:hypothetical protein